MIVPVPWHIIRLWLLLSLAALLMGVLLAPRATLAEDDLNHAGLIVRDGEGRVTYAWVPFAEESIDGIALLKGSGIPVVTVGFGALGEGVCAIAGQGCGVSECRRTVCQASAADAPYWQYFQQDPTDPAIWTWQPLGASATAVRDGDVFGWSWTAAEPGLPALPAPDIAALAGAGDGEGSEPSVRTLLPEGVAAFAPEPAPEARTTVAAAALLAGIAAFALRPPTPDLRPLDPRAWLLWAIAASLPPLLGRNPWPLAATTLAVLGVWAAWGAGAAAGRWRPLMRLALVFGAVSVLFNLLTAHLGDRVIGHLPEAWPIVGGPLTVNSLLYGLLGAVAIFALVAVSATLGATLDWSAMMRLLPERMAPLAVGGSIAWAYLPRTVVAFAEIREAQMARGYRPRGLRDVGPLVMPLLAGGLERSMMTAEALEARAFGAPLAPELVSRPWQVVALVAGLIAAMTGAFCLALGQLAAAGLLLASAAGTIAAGLVTRCPTGASLRRTRYRDPVWERPEWIVSGSAAAVLIVELVILAVAPGAFRYEPYPSMTAPAIDLVLLAALALLLAPAVARRAPSPPYPPFPLRRERGDAGRVL